MTTAATPVEQDPGPRRGSRAGVETLPTLADVYAARERIAPYLPRTPLLRHPLLDQESGLAIRVKHENHLPTCAFKIRGGLNLVGRLSAAERARGVVAASTGNHGQSVAKAAAAHGVSSTIYVPAGCNPEKMAAIRAYGATLEEGGKDFDEARERCERDAAASGARYIHNANEPHLIAGVATYAVEIFEDVPDAGVVLVPVGGGSGACGVIAVRNAVSPTTRVIAVAAVNADAVGRSWHSGERVAGASANTFAEGVATRVTCDLTFPILKQYLDDFILLTEDELAEGVRLALRATHNLAEGAGAASIAAAMKLRDRFAGQKVVCVMSGGNIDRATLQRVLR
jgi:threonine dehydratase